MSGVWRACATADGSWTLHNAVLDESCHSRSGAWQQATERYAGACRLAERARAGEWRVCRLLDIGTGLGLNLAAALAALEPSGVALHALTLEIDPEVIVGGLALYERAQLACGPWERWHAPVRHALRAALAWPGCVVPLGESAARGQLELRLGDARATLLAHAAAKPVALDCNAFDPDAYDPDAFDPGVFDAVFLDPFSPGRAGELWQEAFLSEVARRMAPEAWLSTYSAAFRVRLALVRAGLRVGRGARVGAKGEGTLASLRCAPPALAPRVARRLERRAWRPAASRRPEQERGLFLPIRLREGGPGFD